MKNEWKQIRDALDIGGFHTTARGHIEDALCITEALARAEQKAEV